MMCQTRRMTKTVKNMRLRSHQSYLLWSQESSLRGIKTSPLLLPRWPIRNLCLRYRSWPRPTTSTSTSTNPESEPYTTLDHPGPSHRARTTPPQTPAQDARDLLPSSISYAPLPLRSVPASVLFPPVS